MSYIAKVILRDEKSSAGIPSEVGAELHLLDSGLELKLDDGRQVLLELAQGALYALIANKASAEFFTVNIPREEEISIDRSGYDEHKVRSAP
ncbi:hypothetical protein [Salipiger sp. PrR003]|uniref:hypothetical protein n=1 Tax=Salipiger sp. PrR003 TaxID=2706776 RepID=UPI0013D99109|nr:hypothetical protein [Salipiger sp. PrR003]NDV50551.1 hypothetical protein [Salipiger sp. PrR003]